MNFYRSGSIIVDMKAVLLNHPDAECIFYNKIHTVFPKVNMKENSCEIILDQQFYWSSQHEILSGPKNASKIKKDVATFQCLSVG